ncbi:hypothetical protein SAMN04489761_2732 [Tenacibaculum sp. MAR_2009_124]|uniref:G-D-S-L family lipolytic protein n=1 Tax=Tenacibaculum sp. MAR_2009_124 TaxID=1250059 RepID=UPI00089CD212|nr:G-D-S-L family lipolytic protein [Tenacibaculum sp. MAR_2009_124]SEC34453.1 hypothetical protein SAMN04489761_2732 [Tenacibaculum sp. MAR_2009_124]
MKKNIGWVLGLAVMLTACDVNNELEEITGPVVPEVALQAGSADFSKYISVGASFTAGFTDGAMFIKGQENSFPNILSGKFSMANGGTFNQPLMSDNIGGLVSGTTVVQEPRFYFNGAGPARLDKTPTTQVGVPATGAPDFHNYGVPGAKSFHFVAPGYGSLAGLANGTANPYFVRMSPSQPTVVAEAVSKQPTFFTLSEIGGNDVLGYAIAGGAGVNQTGNLDPATYGPTDITDPNVFAQTFSGIVDALTAGGAKGVVATVPYITSLSYFTTVPYNPVPLDAATAGAVNQGYAAYNAGIQQAFAFLVANTPMTQEMADAEIAKRTITFAEGDNAVVILDEALTDLTAINPALVSLRQTTADDLLVLPGSAFIGTTVGGNPQLINGVSVPLTDQWVLTSDEVAEIKVATDSYNSTIVSVANAKGLALADFKAILEEASTTGIVFDEFTTNTSLVFGGLIGLDGIHLTARGYALMANTILKAIDTTYGSNFADATNGLAKAADYPTNYSPTLE